ncbi:hypothetical protein GJ697_10860 [Pseudoduganella sp. FT25W]|jgi:hypothetical protein|uniref:Uncharacterized protein n=1 Tax=Duganella alba TaxID=2666081 RepID=A0A6L5QF36_9BURK|nr:hypothetical protein [Duganella alba]MRX08336.1 hypothetical protein [Duganella alba]MRX16875.1 hypothetical protein [Duganella alba]
MSTRKKNAEPPRHNKAKPDGPPPPPCTIDIDALLTIGAERVHIVCEEDDNITFMAELIDTV